MSEQTLEMHLCAYHWERFERLADYYGYADRNEYAADLLVWAIEESERWMRSEKFQHYERIIEELEEEQARLRGQSHAKSSLNRGDIDDGIPF